MKIIIAALLIVWSTVAIAEVAWLVGSQDNGAYTTCIYQGKSGRTYYQDVRAGRVCPSRIEA